ncbi:hypothetical protein [Novosphingobium sp. THN1]|uniref:hypothetical protein n=1 Tax=Novosphingobium sp. THN1 TaxID=1016987 RepID=UPI00351301AD
MGVRQRAAIERIGDAAARGEPHAPYRNAGTGFARGAALHPEVRAAPWRGQGRPPPRRGAALGALAGSQRAGSHRGAGADRRYPATRIDARDGAAGPISSINWAFTLLGDAPDTRDGWWLLETASNHMSDGFSSETLRMWNADGVQVMHGLQSVAIFG